MRKTLISRLRDFAISFEKMYKYRELVCIMVKWKWYNGRDKFGHITSGRINTWKGVNQLKKLFFLNLFFLNIYIYLKLTTHRYFIIKNPLFFTILKSKWPYPESDQLTGNPLFTMTTSQCACKPVKTTRAFSRRNQHRAKALCWKSRVAKSSWWCLGIIPSNRCCQFSMISHILEEIQL